MKADGRGRPIQEKVKISEQGEESHMIPIHKSHLDKAGIDSDETVHVKREPRPEKGTIELVPVNQEEEEEEEED